MQLSLERPKELFAVLGERLRLRLACCLLAVKEGLCVCELVDALRVSQPNVSRHLKLMKAADLVEERREGRWVYYRLKGADHPFFDNLRCCLETVCCCGDIQADLRRLRARLKLRRGGTCVVGIQEKRRR
ncbi:MAG: ArsR/SmtB family transcription factor [Terriglobia bacterium]